MQVEGVTLRVREMGDADGEPVLLSTVQDMGGRRKPVSLWSRRREWRCRSPTRSAWVSSALSDGPAVDRSRPQIGSRVRRATPIVDSTWR